MSKPVDRSFLLCIILLMVAGFFIFSSASLGLLAKGGNLYSSAAFSQVFFGLLMGSIAMIITSRIPYKNWRKYAFFLFIASIFASLLVFIPHIGFAHGGARRWIYIGSFTFQPAELLKTAFILYFGAWLTSVKDKVSNIRHGLIPFLIIVGIAGLVMLAQPDTDTFALIFITGVAMYLTAGGKLRHVFTLFIAAVLCVGILTLFRPYLRARIMTFFDPGANSQTSGYQIQQSLIAIGSGHITGRGFGQSVQKFNFLPEPIGDSIFAVAAEEFGFIGSVAIIGLFMFFAIRGLKIAIGIDDAYGRLVVVGFVILITVQAFVNIAAMLGVLPLSGNPLPFVSHGGSSLFVTLAQVGIILNISRYQKKNVRT